MLHPAVVEEDDLPPENDGLEVGLVKCLISQRRTGVGMSSQSTGRQ